MGQSRTGLCSAIVDDRQRAIDYLAVLASLNIKRLSASFTHYLMPVLLIIPPSEK